MKNYLMRSHFCYVVLVIVTVLFFWNNIALSGYKLPSVAGYVTKSDGQKVSGVVVSLFHPDLGRVGQSVTSSEGVYYFFNIQGMETPYYIEVYWDRTLIYRHQIMINGLDEVLNWNIVIQ